MRPAHPFRIAPILLLTTTLPAAAPVRALAMVTQRDVTSPHTLDSTLHLLYIVAGAMGAVLVLVAVLAFAVYRRNGREALTPDGSDDSTV